MTAGIAWILKGHCESEASCDDPVAQASEVQTGGRDTDSQQAAEHTAILSPALRRGMARREGKGQTRVRR
jgi:hypothetical protein